MNRRAASGGRGEAARSASAPLLLGALALLLLLPVPALGRPGAPCPFTVNLTANPSSGTAPLLVRFSASVSSGLPSSYNWSFGDGSYWNSSVSGAATPLHRYSEEGLFTSEVSVDEGGCLVGASRTIAAVAGVLSLTLAARPISGPSPLTVVFNVTVAGGSGTYASASWRFGDGGVGSGLNVEYTYLHPGAYTAVLNVTDSAAHWQNATVRISVTGGPGPSGPFGAYSSAAYLGGASAFAGVLGFLVSRRLQFGATRPAGPPPGPLPTALPPASPGLAAVEGSASAVAAARAGQTPPEEGERLRLTQRVILHIGAQGLVRPAEVAPAGLTQGGMAEQLGVSQNSVTNVLRRLVAAGVLLQDVRHVRGRPRRLRVYQFTPRGEALYAELRPRAPPRGGSASPTPRDVGRFRAPP